MKHGRFLVLTLSLVVATFQTAEALTFRRPLLISVGDLQAPNKLQWKKEICAKVHLIANQINEMGVSVVCRQFDTNQFLDRQLKDLQNQYDYHLRILRSPDGKIQLDVTNWKRIFMTDFQNLQWQLPNEDVFAKVVANFMFFAANQRAYRAALLVHAAPESHSIFFDKKSGHFKESLTHEVLTLERAYRLLELESPRKKNFLQTAQELGAMFAAGLAMHYKDLAVFRPASQPDFGRKAVPLSRFPGKLPPLESFLISLSLSAAWDYIETPISDIAGAAPLSPLAKYLLKNSEDHLLCHLPQQERTKKNRKTCSAAFWSETSSHLGLENGQKAYVPQASDQLLTGLVPELIDITDHNNKARQIKFYVDSAFLKTMTRPSHQKEWRDLKILAQVVAAAYEKHKQAGNRGTLSSYDLDMAFQEARTKSRRSKKKKFIEDKDEEEVSREEAVYGTVDFTGASAHANIFLDDLRIKLEVGFSGDIAMLKSYAISKEELNPFEEKAPPILNNSEKESYYWGFNASTLAAISALWSRFQLGYEHRRSEVSDLDIKEIQKLNSGRDLGDEATTHRIFLRFNLSKNTSLQLAIEHLRWAGSVNGNTTRSNSQNRIVGSLRYVF